MQEEPLLTFNYEIGKVLWRLFFPFGIIFILFGSVLFSINNNVQLNGCNLKDCFGLLFFGTMVVGSLLLSIEMILVKEIRFFKNRIEKEWSFFGSKTIDYSNARLRGINSKFASSKNFMYIKKPTWYSFKCCGYDEHLISEENKVRAIGILAKVTNRNLEELKEPRLEINPLMNTISVQT